MDFQSVNLVNVWLNLVSGNLLPMTADDSSFLVIWKAYSVLLWLLETVHMCVLIPGCFVVPKEKALKDGMIGILVTMEVVFIVSRIHTRRELIQRLIEHLNDILRAKDELMRNVVAASLKPINTPLKFYLSTGVLSIIIWSGTPLLMIYQKDDFLYVDYRMPVIYAKEPFSTNVFVIGTMIVLISNIFIFIKKVSMDSYMINLILLITAQYRYMTLKLSVIFQDQVSWDGNSPDERKHSARERRVERNIKALCRHHNNVIRITLMLRELLALNFSVIYVDNVFRFCFLSIMMAAIPSTTLLEAILIIMYAAGGMVQLYILCSCVQQLLDAAIEITDDAFHEEWYQYGRLIKRTFAMIITAKNMKCKISTFENFTLSLPSFMAILNSSYSIALLLLNIN